MVIPQRRKEGEGMILLLIFFFLVRFYIQDILHGRLEVCLLEARKMESNFGLGLLCDFFPPILLFQTSWEGREILGWEGDGGMGNGDVGNGNDKETRERGERGKDSSLILRSCNKKRPRRSDESVWSRSWLSLFFSCPPSTLSFFFDVYATNGIDEVITWVDIVPCVLLYEDCQRLCVGWTVNVMMIMTELVICMNIGVVAG